MRRTVSQVLTELQRHTLLVSAELYGISPTGFVEGISHDNRTVRKGELFVCKGATFRKEYLDKAIEAGALLYLSETVWEEAIPHITVSDIRLAMAVLAKLFFCEEAEPLTLIGVTGTKGKTTTVAFLNRILDAYHLSFTGRRTALISSLSLYDGTVEREAQLTTPEAIDLWRHLATAGNNRLDYALCEVSSQALKYHRTTGLHFNVAVFLNIGEDHISDVEHKDLEDYFSSKLKIFDSADLACINSACDRFDEVVACASSKGCKIVTFGFRAQDTLSCQAADYRASETVFTASWENGSSETYKIAMKGKYNLENALAALAVAKILAVPSPFLHSALSSAEVKGRGVHLSTQDGAVTAIIDYAHNKMSMEALCAYAHEVYPDREIITVFGCPGEKAQNRRRDMALTAGAFSDLVIITEDDPANESLDKICWEIASFVEKTGVAYEIVTDRGQAIQRAFERLAGRGVILLCGKGAESTQKRGNASIPYETDEYFAKQCIKKYDKATEKMPQ